MQEKLIDGLEIWKFDNLENFPSINHYISGRKGGVSTGELGGLNLSFKVGDSKENVIENRSRLARAMGVSYQRLIFPSQMHTNNAKRVDESTDQAELENTDALVTNVPGILISVMSADCVPVLLYDPINKAVAAIHAGWRGSVARIVEKTVGVMRDEFGSRPENLVAGIGPSICQEAYEVGEEVLAEVNSEFETPELIKKKDTSGKGYLDLWRLNQIQLRDSGVPISSIEIAGICTYTESNSFFSARKSGNKAGRFAAGIMLK